MPLYDFYCDYCEKAFERRVQYGDNTWPCPECGEEANRLPTFSPPLVVYKAPGFYTTDNRVLDENREE